MLRKRGREETGGGTSHPTTLPSCEALQSKVSWGMAWTVLAADGSLSPPPKKTKLQAGREHALTADELDVEWMAVRDDLLKKMSAAGAAITALEQLLQIEKEEAAAREEKFEKKIEELQELLKDSEEVVEVKEKERARLKLKTVSRGHEIAAMREAVSKLKKEKEEDKNKKVPKADKVVQTEAVVGQVAATQTPVRTYASVAAQVEEVRECGGEPTDVMDIDPPGSPKSGKSPQSSQGGTPTSKPTQATPTSGHLARAFVVYGVACHRPWQARIQEVERAFGRKGGGVIGV